MYNKIVAVFFIFLFSFNTLANDANISKTIVKSDEFIHEKRGSTLKSTSDNVDKLKSNKHKQITNLKTVPTTTKTLASAATQINTSTITTPIKVEQNNHSATTSAPATPIISDPNNPAITSAPATPVTSDPNNPATTSAPATPVTSDPNNPATTSAPATTPNAPSYHISLMPQPLKISNDDKIYGNKDSKVVLIEYSSPTCRHCAYYHKVVLPEIKKKYIDTNKIAYVLRMFITNKLDFDAAVIPYCSGTDEKFFTLVDNILSSQDKWLTTGDYISPLTIIASIAGIPKEQYQTCLKDDKISTILMENNRAALTNPKFRALPGTPAFFINGIKFEDAYSAEKLSNALDKAIKETQN